MAFKIAYLFSPLDIRSPYLIIVSIATTILSICIKNYKSTIGGLQQEVCNKKSTIKGFTSWGFATWGLP